MQPPQPLTNTPQMMKKPQMGTQSQAAGTHEPAVTPMSGKLFKQFFPGQSLTIFMNFHRYISFNQT